MPCTGRYPIFVHSFQLSTIDPPADGPILYVGTQLAGSTKALQQAIGSRTPQGGITGVNRCRHLRGVQWVSPQHPTHLPSTSNPSPIFLPRHPHQISTLGVMCIKLFKTCCMS